MLIAQTKLGFYFIFPRICLVAREAINHFGIEVKIYNKNTTKKSLLQFLLSAVLLS